MNKKIIKNCIILDGSAEMVPVAGKCVIIDNGYIKCICDNKAVNGDSLKNEYKDYEIVDLEGRYLMPGLINMHVHLALSGKPPKEKAKDKPVNYKAIYDLVSGIKLLRSVFINLVGSYAKTHLMSGTTTVRTVGGVLDFDSVVRDDINSGKRIGPRILCSNTAVSVPGGHFAGSLGTEASTPEEAAADVRRISQTKPDLIKLMITGGVMDCEVLGEPGILKMRPELVKAACDQAHELGYKVAAHVESPEGIKVALENGVDTIEHGAKVNDELIALFKSTGAALISTTSPAIPYAIFDRNVSHCTEEAHINGKALMDGMIDCTKACIEAGIPVGLGTDASCPFTTHYNMWRELYYFHKYCGASNALALHTATMVNARLAGLESVTGAVAEGLSADLIACRDNPLEDLRALRHVDTVIMKGIVYDRPKFKTMPEVDAALDSVM